MSNFYNRPKFNFYDRNKNPPRSATLSKQSYMLPEDAEAINEFPSYYIDKHGTIYNHYGKTIAPSVDTKGYLKVALYKDNQRYTRRVHVLVAEQFIEKPDNLGKHPVVDHIDQDRTHCSVDNLQWVSQKENIKKSYEQGRIQGTAKQIYCIEDDKTFFSATQAAEYYNISKVTLLNALKKSGKVIKINKTFKEKGVMV